MVGSWRRCWFAELRWMGRKHDDGGHEKETLSLVSTGAAGADGTQACEGASKEDPGYGLLGRCRKRLACHRFF